MERSSWASLVDAKKRRFYAKKARNPYTRSGERAFSYRPYVRSPETDPSLKRANGFTLLEMVMTVALFVFFTVSLLEAFNLGYTAVAEVEHTNLAYYLAGQKMEELRNLPYSSIGDESRTPISGFDDFESEVEVTFPQDPNVNIKKVVVTIHFAVEAAPKGVFLKTLVVNN